MKNTSTSRIYTCPDWMNVEHCPGFTNKFDDAQLTKIADFFVRALKNALSIFRVV
jgi:hypothetical protein